MERRAMRQTGERQRLMSVRSGGGRSTKLAACGRAAEGNRGDLDGLMEIQMRLNSHQNNPANPLNPQPLGEEGKLSYPQIGREQFQPLEDLTLRTRSGHDFRKPLNGHRQCADATSWLVTQPASFFKNSVYLARSSSTSDLLRALCRKQRSSHRPGVEVNKKKNGVRGLRALIWNTFHLP